MQISVPECATVVDESLVARVVQKIQGILKETATRGVDEIGQLLLREFFNDDPTLYASNNRTKNVSLDTVLAQCGTFDLPVKRTWLANALRMAVFSRQLPKDAIFNSLSPSHRVELLRLKSPEKAELFAAIVVKKKLTVAKVRAVVAQERGKRFYFGRRPTLVKHIYASTYALREMITWKLVLKSESVAALSDHHKEQVRESLPILRQRVEELRQAVEAAAIIIEKET